MLALTIGTSALSSGEMPTEPISDSAGSMGILANNPWFTGVGDLPGGGFESQAWGVSPDGAVVVGMSISDGAEAFVWESGLLTGLGEPPGGQFGSWATAASTAGEVIVGYCFTELGKEACYWTGDGLQLMGDLPGGPVWSAAWSVSADGSVIVGYGRAANYKAFRWEAGVMTGLGLGGGNSFAFGVSGDGSIVAGHRNTLDGVEAYRWENGAMIGLGELPGGDFGSFGWGLSADGNVVVGGSHADGGWEAYRWKDDVMIGLGDPPGGDVESAAIAVTTDGLRIVGYSIMEEVGWRAIIWDAYHGMRILEDVLVEDFGLDLEGWTLAHATDMTPDGATIVGYGWNPAGDREGWIARIPPSRRGDIDVDGSVDRDDLDILISEWGPCDGACPGTCAADLDGDCNVGIVDFLFVLGNWG